MPSEFPFPHSTHAVLLPSYNSGALLAQVAEQVLAVWQPVWVVIDGSTDDSARQLEPLLERHPGLHVLKLGRNSGKGGAVLEGLRALKAGNYSHVLVMDADGQHSVAAVRPFMERSLCEPEALILGIPIFGPDAPAERVKGRRVGNWWAQLATLWAGVEDSLFGFRIYPVRESLEIMESIRTARRFDFDTELAVRLVWAGVRPVNIPVPVRYPPRVAGGVTHFRYLRDNLLLIGTHTRLFFGMCLRIPKLMRLRRAWGMEHTDRA